MELDGKHLRPGYIWHPSIDIYTDLHFLHRTYAGLGVDINMKAQQVLMQQEVQKSLN